MQHFCERKALNAFFFLAMAFSAQLLPITIDLLFLRRGTKAGAVAGLVAGMIVVFLFPPLGALLFGEGSALVSGTGKLKALLDDTAEFPPIAGWEERPSFRLGPGDRDALFAHLNARNQAVRSGCCDMRQQFQCAGTRRIDQNHVMLLPQPR